MGKMYLVLFEDYELNRLDTQYHDEQYINVLELHHYPPPPPAFLTDKVNVVLNSGT